MAPAHLRLAATCQYPDHTSRSDVLLARQHRIANALFDLGLSVVVGDRWCRVAGGALHFGDLDVRQSEAFIRRLEDLAGVLPAQRPQAGKGQLPLTFGEG